MNNLTDYYLNFSWFAAFFLMLTEYVASELRYHLGTQQNNKKRNENYTLHIWSKVIEITFISHFPDNYKGFRDNLNKKTC